MSETIEFWQSMKLVHEGKEVQYLSGDVWCDFKSEGNLYYLINSKWRQKPTQVKYSVDVWLSKIPQSDTSLDNTTFHIEIIGSGNHFSRVKTELCNKKYKITVESCE